MSTDPDSAVEVTNWPSGIAGGLTNTELRATPVKVDDDATQALLAGGLPAALTVEGALKTTLVPSAAAGGSSIYRNLDVQTTGVRIKSGAGQVYGWYIYNGAATVRFIKLYDSNTNPPTQADTPALTIAIPAGSAANVAFPNGIAFAAGLGIRASTGVADNDTGAPTANDVIVNLVYK